LKYLPEDFAKFIRRGRLKKVVLHGLIKDVQCKVSWRPLPAKGVKIGYDWNNFYQVHSFQEGDKIIFECFNKPASHMRVLSIMRCYYKSQ